MENTFLQSLATMVAMSHAPMFLYDDNLSFVACSHSFMRCMISFNNDIHDLFDANAIQRIKRTRRTRKPMKITAKTAPYALDIDINWIDVSPNAKPYLLGIVEGNRIYDANHSLSMLYYLIESSQRPLSNLESDIALLAQPNVNQERVIADLEDQLKILKRNHFNLYDSIQILTDSLVLNRKEHNFERILKTAIAHAGDLVEKRNIRIESTFSNKSSYVTCDRKQIIHVVGRCLYCLLAFTPDDSRIQVEMQTTRNTCIVTFTNPLFKIPDMYLDRIMREDVITPNGTDHAGLYVAYAIMRKHNGSLTIDNSPPLGYHIRMEIPLTPPHILIFEDSNDEQVVNEILQEVDLELFDL